MPDTSLQRIPLFREPVCELAWAVSKKGVEKIMMKVFLVAVIILLSSSVSADSIRCGRKVVKTGDSSNTLIKKCGKPERKFSSKEIVNDGGNRSKTSVSNWVYTRGGKKDMIVSVRSGSVIKIQVE